VLNFFNEKGPLFNNGGVSLEAAIH